MHQVRYVMTVLDQVLCRARFHRPIEISRADPNSFCLSDELIRRTARGSPGTFANPWTFFFWLVNLTPYPGPNIVRMFRLESHDSTSGLMRGSSLVVNCRCSVNATISAADNNAFFQVPGAI